MTMYFILVYFNWAPAAAMFAWLASRRGRRRGWPWNVAAAVLQMGALLLHVVEWHRLEGQPD